MIADRAATFSVAANPEVLSKLPFLSRLLLAGGQAHVAPVSSPTWSALGAALGRAGQDGQ